MDGKKERQGMNEKGIVRVTKKEIAWVINKKWKRERLRIV